MTAILSDLGGRRGAVIVNDMSEVNIDAPLIREGGAHFSRIDEALVEMTDRCIGCAQRDGLLREGRRLAVQGRFDDLVIDGTGIAERLPIASTFALRDKTGASLSDIARLDTRVTLVDAANLSRTYASRAVLRDRGETVDPAGYQALSDPFPRREPSHGA